MSTVAGSLSLLHPGRGDSLAADKALSPQPSRPRIVAISADERVRGQLSAETEAAACAAVREQGYVLLRSVFAPALIEAMYREYLSRYGAISLREMQERVTRPPPNPFVFRGEARYQITPRVSGAFGAPEVFANSLLRQVLTPLFDNDIQLNSFTLVVSYPGSSFQPVHRDHAHLFVKPDAGPSLPLYAVNAVIPLIDTDVAGGPTGVWPGSHQWPEHIRPQPETVTAFTVQRGDCLVLDYRTLHSGLANQSSITRPIACMVYARSWFFDDVNYFGTTSLDLPLEEQNKVPESARPVLARARSQAMRSQGREDGSAAPARIDPASFGKVGRNDSCPCGSGRKFKQCHGRIG